jgi:hypothetical protein
MTREHITRSTCVHFESEWIVITHNFNIPLRVWSIIQRVNYELVQTSNVFAVAANFLKIVGLATFCARFPVSWTMTSSMTANAKFVIYPHSFDVQTCLLSHVNPTGHASRLHCFNFSKGNLLTNSDAIFSAINYAVSHARIISIALKNISWGSKNNLSRVLMSSTLIKIWSRRIEYLCVSYSHVEMRDWSSNKPIHMTHYHVVDEW